MNAEKYLYVLGKKVIDFIDFRKGIILYICDDGTVFMDNYCVVREIMKYPKKYNPYKGWSVNWKIYDS